MNLLAILGLIAKPFELVVEKISKWSERRDALTEAKLTADLAEIHARAELAAYKAKADVEWDLAWAGQAQSSWKDEYILILWTIPMLVFLPALFIPGLRDDLASTLSFVQALFGSDVLYWYMGGWGVIFSATFGMKGALQFMVPGNAAKLATTLASIDDDVPDEAVKEVTANIQKKLEAVVPADLKKKLEGKVGLF